LSSTEGGFSLLELIVVIAIVMILAAVAGMNMSSWLGKARVEEQIKRMYADLVSARMRAMNNNRLQFVRLNTAQKQYQIWDDTSGGPDGNGVLDTTAPADTLVVQVNCSDTLWTNIAGTPPQFNFNAKGLISGLTSANDTMRVVSTYGPVVDCVALSSTRIRMGRWDGASSTCVP
jgi:prepilin-type N-terminal cleavage/methylation domain-containing protein